MAVTSSLAGGSFPGSKLLNKKGALDDQGNDKGGIMPFSLTWLPEVLFALGFVYALWPAIGLWALLDGLWSYGWMQSGTGPALQWGKDPEDGMARPRTLSPVVNWISDRLGFKRGDVNYCRAWMAIKGLLITLPVGGLGLILWPLGYEIGERLGSNTYRELLSGAGAGVAILTFSGLIALISYSV